MSELRLYEFTAVTSDDGARVVLVSGRVADHRDSTIQKEYITFQLAVDFPTVRNGAVQRQGALDRAHAILFQLARDFETLAGQSRP
jgi:hypothetical protein